MPKKQHIIKLAGCTVKGEICKTHQASLVHTFRDVNNYIHVFVNAKNARVVSFHDEYTLAPHASIDNLWTGVSRKGNKVHFTKKKVVAKLIHWS
jgi:hypothetical protein